jgi:hypothetical protein
MKWLRTVGDGIELLLAREHSVPGDRAYLFDRVRQGELVRVARGAYLHRDVWKEMDRHARYRATIEAAAALHPGEQVFSHESAAALWRLPALDTWPQRVHVLSPATSGTRSSTLFDRHSIGVPCETEKVSGYSVTTLARTVVDLAARRTLEVATVFVDAALRRADHPVEGIPRTSVVKGDLLREVQGFPLRQGTAKARAAIDFADGLADRPGESISRVSIFRAGLTAPLLQVPIRGASGRSYFVDFLWPEFGLIGEFDGKDKYSNPEFLGGRTPEQALLDEKAREDDLRATGRRMSRWGWTLARSPLRLRAHLYAAGVR